MARGEKATPPADAAVAESTVPATQEQNRGVLNIGGNKHIAIDEIVKQLKDASVGMELTTEYLTLEEGEQIRAAVIGKKMIKAINDNAKPGDEQKMVPAIKLITEEGKIVIIADAVVVSSLLEEANNYEAAEEKTPFPVQIACTGWEGQKGREYRTFKIHAL